MQFGFSTATHDEVVGVFWIVNLTNLQVTKMPEDQFETVLFQTRMKKGLPYARFKLGIFSLPVLRANCYTMKSSCSKTKFLDYVISNCIQKQFENGSKLQKC